MAKNPDIRREIDSALAADSREYGPFRGIITPWDLSLDPEENFRKGRGQKLGRGDQTHFGAIEGTSPDSLRTKLVDGVNSKESTPTRFPLEPDNWVPRLHTEDGLGRDNVWASRMIVEHNHIATLRDHRSTQWIDQGNDQTFANSQDALWITKRRATIKHKELEYDKAGFLASLRSKDGAKSRGALAINIGKNGGFLADTVRVAQIEHLITFRPKRPLFEVVPVGEDTNPKEKRATLKNGLGGKVGARADVGTKFPNILPGAEVEAAFRGDAPFKYDDIRIASFKPEDRPDDSPLDEGDVLRQCFIYVDTEDQRDILPLLDNLEDPTSNQPPIPKKPHFPFKFFVRMPDESDTTYDYSYHTNPGADYYSYAGSFSLGDVGSPPPPADDTQPDGDPRPGVETPGSFGAGVPGLVQGQHGWMHPQSPEHSQRVNALSNDGTALMPAGTFYITKPKGFSRILVETMLKPTDPIPAGQTIELNMSIGQFKDDEGPPKFFAAAIKLDDTTSTTVYTRNVLEFKGWEREQAIPLIVLFYRRTDLTPQPDADIAILRHRTTFRK